MIKSYIMKTSLLFTIIFGSATSFANDKEIDLYVPEEFKPIEWALKAQLDALRFIEDGRLAKEIEFEQSRIKYKDGDCEYRQTLGYTLTRPGKDGSDTLMYIGVTNCYNGAYGGDHELQNIVQEGFQFHFYTRPILAYPRGGRLIFDKAGELVKVLLSHNIPFVDEEYFYVTGEQCLNAVKDFGSFSVNAPDFVEKYADGVHSSTSHAFHSLFKLTCHSLSKAKLTLDSGVR